MVIIKELEIKNYLSLTHAFLHFENNNFATIFNCTPAYELKSKLIRAIQAFFCKDIIEPEVEGKSDSGPGASYIRIKFLMPKEEIEGNDVIDAMRLFTNPTQILYYFNEDQYVEPINVFHERCQMDFSSFYPFLNEFFANEQNYLMNQWILSKCPLRVDTEKAFECLADYLESSNTPPLVKKMRIVKLAQTHLLIDREYEILKKRTFVVVANEIGRIFKYITFEEYSVQFFIPLCGTNMNVKEVKWEDMDLAKIETCVKKTGGQDPCVWNQLEPGLKNILKISQAIAFAKHLKQKLIFIEDTSLLQKYQNQEMIKEAILQKNEIDTRADWHKKNFMKQIVDVCNEMEVSIFINYYGGLPLPPMNANIIKCRESQEAGTQSIYVCTNTQSVSLENFLNLFSRYDAPS